MSTYLEFILTINTFTDLYDRMVNGRPLLALILPGHLAIEFLLAKIVLQRDASLAGFVERSTHAKLIAKCAELGAIDAEKTAVLTLINRTRNKFAHEITYEPTIAELKLIWNAAAKAFTDLTDGISQGLGDLGEKHFVDELEEWVFPELFVQICYDLHEIYIEGGGAWDDF